MKIGPVCQNSRETTNVYTQGLKDSCHGLQATLDVEVSPPSGNRPQSTNDLRKVKNMIDNLVHDIASISDPGESITNKECNYEGTSLSRHFSGTGNYTSGTRPGRVQKTSSAESKSYLCQAGTERA